MMHEQTATIERVDDAGDYWTIHRDDSWVFGAKKDGGPEPRKGDEVTVWTTQGCFTVGWALNGAVRQEPDLLRHRVEREKASAQDRANSADRALSEWDARLHRIEALPAPLRQRIERFREQGGADFVIGVEPYEIFVSEEAARISEHFPDEDAIIAWSQKPHKEQKQDFSVSDEHSSNTFGFAVLLARSMHSKDATPSDVPGALHPISGCDKYGCHDERKGTDA